MDKAHNKPIVDFIEHFKLMQPDGLICFDAKVLYTVQDRVEVFLCEVTIVTIGTKELDVIYIFNPEINERKLKEMFRIRKGAFKYVEGYCLIITEDSITVSIIPTNTKCDDKKMLEILHDYIKARF